MKKLWKPVLLLAAVAIMAFGMLSSGAWFTDTATGQTASVKAGTLSIDNGKVSTASLGTIEKMAPGDVTDEVSIIIENNGNLPLAWFGDLQVSNSMLKNVVYIHTAKMEFLNSDETDTWEPVDMFIANGKGSGTWPTTWGGPENLATLAVYDGNSNMNSLGYEHMGALNPGYKYRLTLAFGMYTGAGNEYQNAGPLDISFKVEAMQLNMAAMNAWKPLAGTNHYVWMTQQTDKQP